MYFVKCQITNAQRNGTVILLIIVSISKFKITEKADEVENQEAAKQFQVDKKKCLAMEKRERIIIKDRSSKKGK